MTTIANLRSTIAAAVKDEISAPLAPPSMPASQLAAFCDRVADRIIDEPSVWREYYAARHAFDAALADLEKP